MFSLFRMFGGNRSPRVRIIGTIIIIALYGARLWYRSNPWIGNSALRESAEIDKTVVMNTVSKSAKGQEVAPGVIRTQLTYKKANHTRTIWVYVPQNSQGKKFPVILMGPAGTRLFHGTGLGQGDMKEELPYTSEGFAVVAYSLDGNLEEEDITSNKKVVQAATEFRNAQAGVLDGRDALDIVLAKFPQLDKNRVYAAGHSSAATLALNLAAYEPRIKGCLAYCACTDILSRLTPDGDSTMIKDIGKSIPNYESFLKAHSPIEIANKIKCPVFLFASKADDNVPYTESETLAQKLKSTNSNVTLKLVSSGDHYTSMIEAGIPAGIAWLKQRGK